MLMTNPAKQSNHYNRQVRSDGDWEEDTYHTRTVTARKLRWILTRVNADRRLRVRRPTYLFTTCQGTRKLDPAITLSDDGTFSLRVIAFIATRAVSAVLSVLSFSTIVLVSFHSVSEPIFSEKTDLESDPMQLLP